jgi:hypothetical protein
LSSESRQKVVKTEKKSFFVATWKYRPFPLNAAADKPYPSRQKGSPSSLNDEKELFHGCIRFFWPGKEKYPL